MRAGDLGSILVMHGSLPAGNSYETPLDVPHTQNQYQMCFLRMGRSSSNPVCRAVLPRRGPWSTVWVRKDNSLSSSLLGPPPGPGDVGCPHGKALKWKSIWLTVLTHQCPSTGERPRGGVPSHSRALREGDPRTILAGHPKYQRSFCLHQQKVWAYLPG